jgi:hypothetical protein
MDENETRMPDPYRVPTRPVDARLVLQEGPAEDVTLFLPTVSKTHSGPETMDEFVNSDRRFFPVKSRDSGRSFLVSRNAILMLEVGTDAPMLFKMEGQIASSVELVRLELDSGLAVEGSVRVITPPEKARLSDFFNQEDKFVPVETAERVTYVNKDHVVCVRF